VRSRRADAERNRALILAAAQVLFDVRGADAPLDEVARRAGVANATLYRHFATRADLLVAAYAEEIAELDELSRHLVEYGDADQALADWLRAFVQHVATKRDLALAIPDQPDTGRTALFADWHQAMLASATRLLTRAQAAGSVRPDLTALDLLSLAGGLALSGRSPAALDAMRDLLRHGYSRSERSGAPGHTSVTHLA
jgi:AcrR family transcriptional regulator